MKLLALALALFSTPLFAQNQKFGDTIVVTASELPETLESTPASITIITRKQIDEQAGRDVADLLREVPGLTISRTGSNGKTTSLFTRGGASTQTLVLWNGIEINNPYFAGYDWGRFSTVGVEQVEVVRGPFSALYGSDAMSGVVNILTSPKSSGVTADLESGGHGLRNGSLGGSLVGSAGQISGAIERREDDGFNPNDDFRENSGNVFANWTPSKTFSLGLAGRRTSYDLGIPFNVNAAGTALTASPKRRQDGIERQLAIPITWHSYELRVSETINHDNFHDPEDPSGFTFASTNSKTRRARLVTRNQTPFGTIVAGAQADRATVSDNSSFGTAINGNRRSGRSLFVEDRWSHDVAAGRVEMSAGARYDNFTSFGSQTSPRLAVAFVEGGNKWRAAYGEAFRAPSIGELYFPFAGNLALRSERSRNLEVGFDNSLFSATLFRSRYRDLIFFDNATFAFANIGRVRSDGLELGANESIGRFTVRFSYTYLHKDEDESTGERLVRHPKHSGSVALGWSVRALDTNLLLVRSGARADILPIFPYSRVINGAYTVIDANVQYHAGRLIPFVKIENLTNVQYQEVFGYQSPGRRLIVGLRLKSL